MNIALRNPSERRVFNTPTALKVSPVNKTPDTALLVLLIKSRSERGFTFLYNNYYKALYLTIVKFVKSTEVADELLQDTFVKIWKNIDMYDPAKGTLYTWMLKIARNLAIDYLRSPVCKNQKQHVSIDLMLHNEDNFNHTTSNHVDLDFKDFKAKALQIDQKYAKIIEMIFFYGYTHQQTARVLNLPLGTVKTRARKGLSMLKTLYH